MPASLLDGRALGRQLNKALKGTGTRLARPPGLAVVLVGSDPASEVYVRRKGVVAGRLGFVHRQINLPAGTSMVGIVEVVRGLNDDPAIDGILVQLPLPDGQDGRLVTEHIDPTKDVDGLTTVSAGRLAQGNPGLIPCTPKGVMRLLDHSGVPLQGRRALVIGRSNLVGRPVAMLLEHANATVTVAHSRTVGVESLVRDAEIVVAAVGRPGFVKGEWIRDGAVVVDVGINRLADDRLVGDVETEAATQRAAWITPVPGGVGPMTIAMLMENTFEASAARQDASPARLATASD